jgi:ABC-type transporter Mla subunit MlaD
MKVIEYDFDRSINDLDKLATNPDLTASISNVAKATKGLSDSSENLAKTTADVQNTVHVYTERLNKPKTFAQKVGGLVVKGIMASASGIIGWVTK